jgi:hypothetical protein
MNFKKVLAVLLSAALLLCLAACGGKATTTKPTGGTAQTFEPEAEGMLYLSMGAEIKVSYDKNGNVMTAEPANEAGQEILAETPVTAGAATSAAVAELVKAAVSASTSDLKVILIKQAYGSSSPSKEFLGTIQAEAEAVAGSCKVIPVAVEELTADGYMPIDTIKAIFMANLGKDSAEITVTEDLANGFYYVAYKNGDVIGNYTVDADNGIITYLEDTPVIEVIPEEETIADDSFDPEENIPCDTEVNVDDPVSSDDIVDNGDTSIEDPFDDELVPEGSTPA